MNKRTIMLAVCSWLSEWIKGAEFSPINIQLGYVSCEHDNNADMSLLKEFGIKVPPHYEEKHWAEGVSEFAFFLTNENVINIVAHAKRLKG